MGTTPDRQYGRELATEPEVEAKLATHRDRTLLHALDRDGALVVVRDAAGRIQRVEVRDGVGGPLIRETELARDASGRAQTITDRQYEPPGTLARTRALTLTRGADGKVVGGTTTVN